MSVLERLPGVGGNDDEGDDAADEEVSDVDEEQNGGLDEETRPYQADALQDLPDEWLAEYEPPRDGRVTDSLSQLHRDFVAPTDVEIDRDIARLGDKWVQSLFINEWPQNATAGFLETLFKDSHYDTDVALHIEPRDNRDAVEDLKDNVSELQIKLEEEEKAGSVQARDTQLDLENAQRMYDLVNRGGSKLVDCSMYVNHRGPTREAVEERANEVLSLLQKPPASTDPRVATRNQDRAITSASPIGMDSLGKKNAMMGGAIGAMMPFSSATLIEENGVDWGIMPYNRSPVIVDRFGRDTGYNVLVIGNIGSGKSFSTKLNLVRTILRRNDVDLIMLDPLEGFVGVTQALRGERIRVGGDVGLNPLEIRETPVEILEQKNVDIDPYGSKIKDVMSFFETYFHIRDFELGDWRGILERAVQTVYERHGITRDPRTHDNESPLITDLLNVLGEMTRNPDEFARSGSEAEREQFKKGASKLLVALEPFQEGGEFENLSRETEIDISDSRVTYLDLQEQEGRGGMGMMMQLLFNAVYERAKQTDNKTIFAIDEARYIMKDSASLQFLEQAVRHSRHYDLSIQFITQTIDEFFAAEEAEAIADNCSIKQLNRVEGLDDEIGIGKLDMNEEQVEFARTATPGDKERGYSEALIGIQGRGWRPIHVRASETETAVVDFEPEEGESLPGPTETDDAQTSRIQQALSASTEAEENVVDVGTESRSFSDKLGSISGDDDDDELPEAGPETAVDDAGQPATAADTEAQRTVAGDGADSGGGSDDASGELDDYSREELLEAAGEGDRIDTGDGTDGGTDTAGDAPGSVGGGDGTGGDLRDAIGTGNGSGGGDSGIAPVSDADLRLDEGDGNEGDGDSGVDAPISSPSDDEPHAYYLQIVVNTDNDGNSGSMVLDGLEDAAEVVATDPDESDIRAGDFTIGFDAVVVSSIRVEEVRTALQSIDEVTSVDTDTLDNAHKRERAAEHFDGVTAVDLERAIDDAGRSGSSNRFFTGTGGDGLDVDDDRLDEITLDDGDEGEDEGEDDAEETEAVDG